jgi:hypothetical protein
LLADKKIDVHVYNAKVEGTYTYSRYRNLIQPFNELDIFKDKLALADAAVDCIHVRKTPTRGLVQ